MCFFSKDPDNGNLTRLIEFKIEDDKASLVNASEYFDSAFSIEYKAMKGSNIVTIMGTYLSTATVQSRALNVENMQLIKDYTPIKAGYYVKWGFPFSKDLDFHIELVANSSHPIDYDMYYIIAKEGANLAELEYSTAAGRELRLTSFDFDFKDAFFGCYQAQGGTSAFSYYLAIDIVKVEYGATGHSLTVIYDTRTDTEFPDIE
jgi:hypothetical protein